MRPRILIALSLLTLVACATTEEQAERQRLQDERDQNECLKLGFRLRTDAFADCRLRLKEMRVEASRPVASPYFGVGYSTHYDHRHW